jgi:hypothetical protein
LLNNVVVQGETGAKDSGEVGLNRLDEAGVYIMTTDKNKMKKGLGFKISWASRFRPDRGQAEA